MQLSYRGSAYDFSSATLEVLPRQLTGKYRGVAIAFTAPLGVAQPKSMTRLSYRGADYIRIQ